MKLIFALPILSSAYCEELFNEENLNKNSLVAFPNIETIEYRRVNKKNEKILYIDNVQRKTKKVVYERDANLQFARLTSKAKSFSYLTDKMNCIDYISKIIFEEDNDGKRFMYIHTKDSNRRYNEIQIDTNIAKIFPIDYFAKIIFNNSSNVNKKIYLAKAHNSYYPATQYWLYIFCENIDPSAVYAYLALTKERKAIEVFVNIIGTFMINIYNGLLSIIPDYSYEIKGEKINHDLIAFCKDAEALINEKMEKVESDKIVSRNRLSAPFEKITQKIKKIEKTGYKKDLDMLLKGVLTYQENGNPGSTFTKPANIDQICLKRDYDRIHKPIIGTLEEHLIFDIYTSIVYKFAAMIKKYHKSKCKAFAPSNNYLANIYDRIIWQDILSHPSLSSYALIFNDEIKM